MALVLLLLLGQLNRQDLMEVTDLRNKRHLLLTRELDLVIETCLVEYLVGEKGDREYGCFTFVGRGVLGDRDVLKVFLVCRYACVFFLHCDAFEGYFICLVGHDLFPGVGN